MMIDWGKIKMLIKDSFYLLKDIPNILDVSLPILVPYIVENGPRKLFVEIKRIEHRINHFTQDTIFNLMEGIRKRGGLIRLGDFTK